MNYIKIESYIWRWEKRS